MPSAPAFCAYELWKVRRPTLSTATPSVRRRPKSITTTACLRIDLVIVQKSLELLCVEIRQDFIAGYKRGHVGLSRKLLHLLVCLPILPDVDLLELIAVRAEIILGINTPGAPLAAVELQLHRRAEEKPSLLHNPPTTCHALLHSGPRIQFPPNHPPRAPFPA